MEISLLKEELDTKLVLLKRDVLKEVPRICEELFGISPFIVVSDTRIWEATKSRRGDFPESFPRLQWFLLPGEPCPSADNHLVEKVKVVIKDSGAIPLAFGSGIINDVVKRASFELGLRYVCLPTAPSVDGYTAFGAAISQGGFKITRECTAPLAVIADEDILRQAPLPLISAGYGDLVAKILSSVDWVVGTSLNNEPILWEVWESIREKALPLLDRGKGVKNRVPSVIEELWSGLITSGLGMQICKSSRPASGSEHLFNHVWEMDLARPEARSALHGYRVSLGTLLSCALMGELFQLTSEDLERSIATSSNDVLGKRFQMAERYLKGHRPYEFTINMIRTKTLFPSGLKARRETILDSWDTLRETCKAWLPSFKKLKTSLEEAGCPTEPVDLGLNRKDIRASIVIASLIRNRYTVLDLMAETGLLESLTERVLTGKYFSHYAF